MNRFAFALHPLDLTDVARYEPRTAAMRPPVVEKVVEWTPAYVLSHITGVRSVIGVEAEGWFLCVPFLPCHFLRTRRQDLMVKIVGAAQIAEELGAGILGLGGFTSIISGGGNAVARKANIAVTTGNSFTIAMAVEAALKGARVLEIDQKRATAAVVGATGSIGSVCARLLAPRVERLWLVAPNRARLDEVAGEIAAEGSAEVIATDEIGPVMTESDIVISATSSGGGIIPSAALKPGSVVCDVSLPYDVSRDVADTRPDVLVIEGGVVEPPSGIDLGFDIGYGTGKVLACMAETMILCLEGRFEHFSRGMKIENEQVDEIRRLARRHGFRLAGFRCFGRPVDEKQIARVRDLAARRRRRYVATGNGRLL